MKKIVYVHNNYLDIIDSKEYIIIEKDNQRISDKYVDVMGDKMEKYGALKKGDIIIRGFYYIQFRYDTDILVCFVKFKFYEKYRNDNKNTPGLKQDIRTKNSYFDFNHIKKRIVEMFSRNIEIEIS